MGSRLLEANNQIKTRKEEKRMQSTASRALVGYIKRKGIKGSAICEATGITINVLYPCLQGRREFRADEYIAICQFTGADPMKLQEESEYDAARI